MPAATRARVRAVAQPTASSSDDEAPEEVSLTTGKVTAEGQQKQEQQAQVAVRQTAKAARQQREQRRAAAAAEAKSQAAERPSAGGEGGADAGEEPLAEDRLPDAVVAALAERQRARAAAGSQQQAEAADAAEARERMTARERRKRRRLTERRDGPITFRLLGADPVGMQRSEAAKQFLREQLLGEGRLKRSADMLRPTRIRGGRSGPLYYGPPAKR